MYPFGSGTSTPWTVRPRKDEMNRLADPESRSMGPGRSGHEEGCLVSGSVSALNPAVAVTMVEIAGAFSFSFWDAMVVEVEPGCVSTVADGGKHGWESGMGAGWIRK